MYCEVLEKFFEKVNPYHKYFKVWRKFYYFGKREMKQKVSTVYANKKPENSCKIKKRFGIFITYFDNKEDCENFIN